MGGAVIGWGCEWMELLVGRTVYGWNFVWVEL